MSRTLTLKISYVTVLLLVGATVVGFIVSMSLYDNLIFLLFLSIMFLLPGRVQGAFYRDFFRARRLHDADKPKQAVEHLNRFIADLLRQPWKKKLIWLSWAIYTTDAEAMAWNNVGSAKLSMGEWSQANQAFETALTIDPLYPLPHENLAKLAMLDGDQPEAERRIDNAARLGYRATPIDQLIHQAQALLAKAEG